MSQDRGSIPSTIRNSGKREARKSMIVCAQAKDCFIRETVVKHGCNKEIGGFICPSRFVPGGSDTVGRTPQPICKIREGRGGTFSFSLQGTMVEIMGREGRGRFVNSVTRERTLLNSLSPRATPAG